MAKLIPLIGKYAGNSAIVDDDDYEYLSGWKWHGAFREPNLIYASRVQNDRLFLMHIEILGKRENLEIDHKDGNGLNNQRDNLRHCTHAENQRNRRVGSNNTSGFRGVYLDKQTNKWIAKIKMNGKIRRVRGFNTPEDASKKYNQLAQEWFGEYARLNPES